MTSGRAPGGRRNNAPIRPRRKATGVPDLLFACAAVAWAMAAVFVASSFFDPGVTLGEPGKLLARIFAGMLALTGIFLFLLGLVLLRDEKDHIDHYATPMAVGALAGAIEGVLFLWPAENLLALPFVLLVFSLRPVRRRLSRTFGTGR